MPYAPLKIPFYVVLGNHDSYGNSEAQIEYSRYSKWWNMPDRFYQVKIGNTHLIGIDSYSFDDEQAEFVEKTLNDSTAKWKIVFGHHPVRSYGFHRGKLSLKKKLLPLLCRFDAIYLSGHDHDLQVLNSDCKTPLVVSGAAAKLRKTGEGSRTLFAKSTYGYAWMSFGKKSFQLRIFDQNDKPIFSKLYKGEEHMKDRTYFMPVVQGKIAACYPGNYFNGIRYSNRRDDHILGIFCFAQAEKEAPLFENLYIEVADRPGRSYDVFCPKPYMYIRGLDFNLSDDKHLKGFYCAPLPKRKASEKYYVKVDGGLDRIKVSSCLKKKK